MYQNSLRNRQRNPRENANVFSMVSFLFTWRIFQKSTKRELVESDVYAILSTHRSSMLGDQLETEWNKEVEKDNPSLFKALSRVFFKEYMIYGIINFFINNGLLIIKPLAMGKLIAYFSPNSTLTKNDAYFYAGTLITCIVLFNVFKHTYQLWMSQLGLKIRIALCSLTYRKSLKLTQTSLIALSNGKLVTLISKDVNVFEGAISFFHDLWVGFIRLFIMSYIMYLQIDVAAFFGIMLLMAMIPVQMWVASKTAKIRLKTANKTDERLKRIQELLTSIKLVKYYCWEKYYDKLTQFVRKEEIQKLRMIYYLKAIILTLSQLSQRMSFYLCILMYINMGNILTAEKVFVVLQCYGNLRYVLTIAVPMCVAQFAEAKCSLQRIKSCLLSEDVEQITPYQENITKNVRIAMKNVSVEITGLSDITFNATPSLIGLTGGVGSGKSTFLKTLLRDVQYSGSISVNGSMSYASQEPWLFPATIRQNILFGLDYDPERYENIVNLCALKKDLEQFPLGDMTLMSDKGLNLSKGQQARINLARAVYKESDIYLLDDIMSSLDATVSRQIFNNCIKSFLKDKLIILVTHNKDLLKETDRVVVLKKGSILDDGVFDELQMKGITFEIAENIDSQIKGPAPEFMNTSVEDLNAINESTKLLDNNEKDDDLGKLYGEHKQEGKIGWHVYKAYLSYIGGLKSLLLITILFVGAQLSISYFDVYITSWLKIEESYSSFKINLTLEMPVNNTAYEMVEKGHYNAMYIYTGLIALSVLLFVIKLFTYFSLATHASRRIHQDVFSNIIRATMSFFDSNLSGNILNRFSRDICIIDEYLPYTYYEALRVFFATIGIVTIVSFINPRFLVPTSVILIILLWARRKFLKTSRTLRRLEGITRAPVVGYLNTSLEGLTTIRASGAERILKKQFDEHQDLNSSVTYMGISTSRAFALWIDMLSTCYVSIIVFSFLVFDKTLIEGLAGKVGLAISQAFQLTGMLQWGVRQWAEIENVMTCVERVLEYKNVEEDDLSGIEPNNWPNAGEIEYKNVSLKYTKSKKYILHDINFTIKPKERIGIVGRTGAGKSSIISALFRLYDIKGSIVIDRQDIADIELPIVRSKISIIPQDPVLFAGTIRTNLDPNDEFTDLQIWNALKQVQLSGLIECNCKEGLSSKVNEGGVNFSIGQRQLLCLARALMRNNKILILDEATANIDSHTDAILQDIIKRVFSDCTILTIAHRLNTIIDSDKIMVVDGGRVLELDNPRILLDRKNGIFYSMAKQAGLAN